MIRVSVIIEEKTAKWDHEHIVVFEGDELTSAESQAIIWLRERQKDAFDV